jgi:ABC-2 type transport system permease protein
MTASTVAVWRIELIKLAAQRRVRAIAALTTVAPFLAVLVVRAEDQLPSDTLFGRWLHTSGYAWPLVVLGFAGTWALPALAGVVGGDIFSTEDHHGTWRTYLTRSTSRNAMFAGKALAAVTWSMLITLAVAASSTAAGVLVLGRAPLTLLDGSVRAGSSATAVIALSWLTVLPAVIGFTALAVLLSVTTRSSVVGVLGTVVAGLLMQVFGMFVGNGGIRGSLLTTSFDAWHSLAQASYSFGPIWHGFAAAAAWTTAACWIARRDFLARDVSTA